MAIPSYRKHPSRTMSLPIDVINAGSLTLSNASASSSPVGLTVTPAIDNTLKRVTLLIAGGSNGTTYRVTTTFDVSNGEKPIDLIDIVVDVESDQ